MFKFKGIKISIILALVSIFSMAQMVDPIHWESHVKKLPDGNYELIMKARMDEGWHIYSSTHAQGGVGVPTTFQWKENKNLKKIGEVKEIGELHDEFVEAFGERQKYYGDEVSFVQQVQALKNTQATVEVMFQACDDSRCIAPDYKTFTFNLGESKAGADTTPGTETEIDSLALAQAGDLFKVAPQAVDTAQSPDDKGMNEPKVSNKKEGSDELLTIFILGFIGGFTALLMPCIFPMIPLTVSMFTKQSKDRKKGIIKALVYGISIMVIYVILGLIITLVFGPDALNKLAADPRLNIAFFILFVIFAISFFGAFEITLPSKWINKADKKADRGGYIGIFFMALTLTLVSFSCTGPIIGTLLVDAAVKGALFGPAVGMLGFSLALALPFTLFAIFPSWLNSLPNSGGWLNTVKVSLGFIELAFALKFLSNADLNMDWHILEREVFIAVWVAIFFCLGLYLLNIFKMKSDSAIERIGTGRLIFAILSFVCVFYLLPGLWGAPLKVVSGLIPPKNYSEAPMGFLGNPPVGNIANTLPEKAEYGPHQIPTFHDLEDAIAYAKKVNKPIMIDFTGKTCANCRRVEDNVWSDPKVKEKLSNEVVLASLYVDSFTELPKEKQVYSEQKGRKLKTVGDKWSEFQIKEFQSNSQPLYIIVDENLQRFNEPIGVELNVENYLKWMDKGIENYKSKKK